MKNLLFIGFKKSGKSTIAYLLSQKLKRTLFDTDLLIEDLYFQKHQMKKSCFEIYQEHQESYFRLLEKEAIASLSLEKNALIATGGGAILVEENVKILKNNGLCIFLDAPLHLIQDRLKDSSSFLEGKTSPLLEQLFQERRALYFQVADIRIEVENKSKEEVVQEIIGAVNGKQ
jgi:shikimate kinase